MTSKDVSGGSNDIKGRQLGDHKTADAIQSYSILLLKAQMMERSECSGLFVELEALAFQIFYIVGI